MTPRQAVTPTDHETAVAQFEQLVSAHMARGDDRATAVKRVQTWRPQLYQAAMLDGRSADKDKHAEPAKSEPKPQPPSKPIARPRIFSLPW